MIPIRYTRRGYAAALALSLCLNAGAADDLKAVHQVMDPDAIEDDLGISVPIPISHPARRYPATDNFPTGPDVGERLPDIRLSNQHGEPIDFHELQRSGSAVVLFFRSAVW